MKEYNPDREVRRIDVTIILPAYNEADSIGKVIDDINAAMKQQSQTYEILVVDDHSDDATCEVSRNKGARVISRSRRQGAGAARKTGIVHARGAVIAMLDADGTYAPSDIPKLLQHFPEFDQVNGARTSEQGTLKLLRFPAKWLIRKIACYLTDTNIPDLNTGLKAFKRDIMMHYLWVIPDGFSCVSTMTLAFLINGYAVHYVPCEYYKRSGGSSKFNPFKDTFSYFITVLRMIMYFNPLKIFLPLSAFFLVVGTAKTLYDRFWGIKHMQLSDIVLILAGIMIGVLGLIADLIVAQGRARDYKKIE